MSPRNEFEQNIPLEEGSTEEVPLTLGVGGPVVGTAKIVDGQVVGEITDEDLLKELQGDLSSFALGRRDPADRYRSMPIDAYAEEWYRQNPDAPRQ